MKKLADKLQKNGGKSFKKLYSVEFMEFVFSKSMGGDWITLLQKFIALLQDCIPLHCTVARLYNTALQCCKTVWPWSIYDSISWAEVRRESVHCARLHDTALQVKYNTLHTNTLQFNALHVNALHCYLICCTILHCNAALHFPTVSCFTIHSTNHHYHLVYTQGQGRGSPPGRLIGCGDWRGKVNAAGAGAVVGVDILGGGGLWVRARVRAL